MMERRTTIQTLSCAFRDRIPSVLNHVLVAEDDDSVVRKQDHANKDGIKSLALLPLTFASLSRFSQQNSQAMLSPIDREKL